MGFEKKQYIRKVEVTKVYFEVIETKDEIGYISKTSPKLVIGRWQTGNDMIKVLDSWRFLTESEAVMIQHTRSNPVIDPDEILTD